VILYLTSCTTTKFATPKGKKELMEYYNSGTYNDEINRVIENAKTYLKNKGKIEKQAVVFDIDETVLSNFKFMKENRFEFDLSQWEVWANAHKAMAIPASLKFYNWVKNNGYTIFFVTGRSEAARAGTIRNLKDAGFSGWKELIMRNDAEMKLSMERYKTNVRKNIIRFGYHIVANIGDQDSDLSGGYADASFKLPNPFYVVK
jgi:acid phosphatase